MDALIDPTNKVSAWLKQLDDLSDQIECQAALAAKTAVDGLTPEITSLHSNDWTGFQTLKDDVGMPFASEFMPNDALRNDPPKMATEPSTLAAAKRQKRSREVIEPAAESAPPEKRSRNMNDGYYDRSEQSTLSELTPSVSMVRCYIRNTGLEVERTMVAWIKRPAEADVLDGRIDNEENDLEELPSPGSVSTSKERFSALYPTPPPSSESEGAEDPSLDLSVKDLDAEAPPGIIEVDPDDALPGPMMLRFEYKSTRHMSPANPDGWVVDVRTF